MALILIFALFIALLIYTLGYYVSNNYWFGDIVIAIGTTICLIVLLVIAF